MKLQYFGDVKDYFKYDLLHWIMELSGYNELLFIPMLTYNDKKNYGKIRNLKENDPGYKNDDLRCILSTISDSPDFTEYTKKLKLIFQNRKMHFISDYYCIDNRDEYFKKCSKAINRSKIIFLDPDIGIEPQNYLKSKDQNAYIEYRNLLNIVQTANPDSCIIAIQFHQDLNSFFKSKFNILSKCGLFVTAIANEKAAFFIITKTLSAFNKYENIINQYSVHYPKLKIYSSNNFGNIHEIGYGIGVIPSAFIDINHLQKITISKLENVNFNNKKLIASLKNVNLSKEDLKKMFHDRDGNIIFKTGAEYFMLNLRIRDLVSK